MMPCDWIGRVTMRSDTLIITSTIGMMNRMPGSRTLCRRPNRSTTPRSYCFTMRTDMKNSTIASTPTMIRVTQNQTMGDHLLGAGDVPHAAASILPPGADEGAAERMPLQPRERPVDVVEQVVDVFDADREAHDGLGHLGLGALHRCMRHLRRVVHE